MDHTESQYPEQQGPEQQIWLGSDTEPQPFSWDSFSLFIKDTPTGWILQDTGVQGLGSAHSRLLCHPSPFSNTMARVVGDEQESKSSEQNKTDL